jgi:iron complex transport system ATP-binding protein
MSAAIANPAIVLSARDLSVSLGGNAVIRNASLTLEAGRFVVLIGPNGAGKTTLLRALAGLIPAIGAIAVDGKPLAELSRQQRARTIAFLPQGHPVHWPLAARDIVALGRFPHGALDPARLSPEDAAIVDAAMTRTGTIALADRIVQTLSGGERARIMLARVLAVGAPILLADEPTAALDPHHQIGVMEDLRAEAHRGTLVVAVTHDLPLAARLADTVILMHRGEILHHGTPETVLTDAVLADVYGIRAISQEIAGERLLVPWKLVP